MLYTAGRRTYAPEQRESIYLGLLKEREDIMSIQVIKGHTPVYPLSASHLVNGKAYESEKGNIYICNRTNTGPIAFEVTGNFVVASVDSGLKFREVNLEIIVK